MKVIRSVLLSAVFASMLSSCLGGPASETDRRSGALGGPAFTCGEPPTTTPDRNGTYNIVWPVDNDPRTSAYHATMGLTGTKDGHVFGTINQPVEWIVNPNDPSTIWDWKVFGTENGPNLFLFAIPNPHCCDDPWYFELTDHGGGLMAGEEYGGFDHNDKFMTFTAQRVSGFNRTLTQGTPHMCPVPVAIPFDGSWNFNWNTGAQAHYCQTGSLTNPVYIPCATSGTFTLRSEINDGYLIGSTLPDEHGFMFGWQNGNNLQLLWTPTTYRDDSPWWFEGAYNDVNGYTFLSPEYSGNDHHQITDSTGHPLAFSMSRTITVP